VIHLITRLTARSAATIQIIKQLSSFAGLAAATRYAVLIFARLVGSKQEKHLFYVF
jgi:hypothetical protein